MKVNIFYSWQSDLPNSKNRNLIESCLRKAIRLLKDEIKEVSELKDTIKRLIQRNTRRNRQI